jgi:hypothetical protein
MTKWPCHLRGAERLPSFFKLSRESLIKEKLWKRRKRLVIDIQIARRQKKSTTAGIQKKLRGIL